MDKTSAMREYFTAMVTYRIISITSTLARLQVSLLENKDNLSPKEMDAEINRLEDVRLLLAKSFTGLSRASQDIP